MAIKLDEYANKYKHAMLERRDGILQVTLHTNGKELEWGGGPHEELSYLFADIARDFENKVVILTGTGECFCANPPLTGSGELEIFRMGSCLQRGQASPDEPPEHRGADDRGSQRSRASSCGISGAVRYRAGRRAHHVPGFRAFPQRHGARRWRAHRVAAGARR